MDYNININTTNENIKFNKINYLSLQKMAFIYNALEDGWQISKNRDKYVFTKKHEEKKEVFLDSYLQHFLKNNLDIRKIN